MDCPRFLGTTDYHLIAVEYWRHFKYVIFDQSIPIVHPNIFQHPNLLKTLSNTNPSPTNITYEPIKIQHDQSTQKLAHPSSRQEKKTASSNTPNKPRMHPNTQDP